MYECLQCSRAWPLIVGLPYVEPQALPRTFYERFHGPPGVADLEPGTVTATNASEWLR